MHKLNERFLFVGRADGNEFLHICQEWRIPTEVISLNEFPDIKPERYSTLFFMPGYFEWENDLDFKYQTLKTIKRFRDLNKGIYSEYVQADDYLLADAFIFKQNFPPRPAGLERCFVAAKHYVTGDFPELAILPVRNCSFLPGQRRAKVLLAFASFLGTYQAFDLPPVDQEFKKDYLARDIWPALLSLEGKTSVVGEGGVAMEGRSRLFATFELSRFREKNFPLAHHWERLARRIVPYLLPAEARAARGKELIPLSVAGRARSKAAARTIVPTERDRIYRQALDRLMRWYLESGVMPDVRGTKGVYEGFRSYDHKLIPVHRSDCNTESALAIFLYGRLVGRPEYCRTAENIFSFLWKMGWQDLNPANATCGLWKFYDDFDSFTRVAYPNDNGEAGRALFALNHYNGNKQYLERAILTSQKFYDLRFHLKKGRVEGHDLNRLQLAGYLREQKNKGNYDSHLVHPDVGVLYLYAYQATGDKKYLAAVEDSLSLKGTFEPGQLSFLFLTSLLYALTGKSTYRRRLDQMLADLEKNMLPAGCLVPSKAPRHLKHTNRLYGLSEVDVRHDVSEQITDQLYVNAQEALNVYSAYTVTKDRKYLEMFFRLMDFLVTIQLRSSDKRLDGAWMRAFDCRNWDYYGSNGDIDWGPYCIESGWSNAWIGMALALYLQNESLIYPAG